LGFQASRWWALVLGTHLHHFPGGEKWQVRFCREPNTHSERFRGRIFGLSFFFGLLALFLWPFIRHPGAEKLEWCVCEIGGPTARALAIAARKAGGDGNRLPVGGAHYRRFLGLGNRFLWNGKPLFHRERSLYLCSGLVTLCFVVAAPR